MRIVKGMALCLTLPVAVIAGAAPTGTHPNGTSGKEDGLDYAVPEECWLAATVNGYKFPQPFLFIKRQGNNLLARHEDIRAWRLLPPNDAAVRHNGSVFYPLDAFEGLSYRIDDSLQELAIDAAPALFETTAIEGGTSPHSIPDRSSIGGFVNYDLFADHARRRSVMSGLFELGAFGPRGAVTSNFIWRDERLIRLTTTWNDDRPGQVASLRIGDAAGIAGSWGRSVQFGGVQWASNFTTQPGMGIISSPNLAGEAILPSTLDLFVNDALRMRAQVPAGPFAIQGLPTITGQGEARLVVRDPLGHEQIVTSAYYASPRVLKEGLQNYAYEAGFIRRHYGIASADYGRFFAAGTHRLGITGSLTGEARAELLRDQQTLGLNAALLWPAAGVVFSTVAASRSRDGTGWLAGVGIERQGKRFGFGASSEFASPRFAQIGLAPGEAAPSRMARAFMSFSSQAHGAVNLAYVYQDRRTGEDARLFSLSYGIAAGKLGHISISLLRFLGDSAKSAASLTFTRSLGDRASASVAATTQHGTAQAQLRLQQNLPSGDGSGYHFQAGGGPAAVYRAGIAARNRVGTYTLDAARMNGESELRASTSGGLAVIGGDLFATRRIHDSFAVVQLPDYPNVRVYADNQLVARTDSTGSALVPGLRAYQANPIRIEQADLPLDARIDSLQVDAVPYFRSGLVLGFPVKRSYGGLISVVLDSGEPIPAGALARIDGSEEEFPSGRSGKVYLTGLSGSNRVRVTWRGQSCEFDVSFVRTDDPLPDLGTVICAGVKP